MSKHEAKVAHALKRAQRRAAVERKVRAAVDREVERYILKRLTGRGK